jgi:hypothetical protein
MLPGQSISAFHDNIELMRQMLLPRTTPLYSPYPHILIRGPAARPLIYSGIASPHIPL